MVRPGRHFLAAHPVRSFDKEESEAQRLERFLQRCCQVGREMVEAGSWGPSQRQTPLNFKNPGSHSLPYQTFTLTLTLWNCGEKKKIRIPTLQIEFKLYVRKVLGSFSPGEILLPQLNNEGPDGVRFFPI